MSAGHGRRPTRPEMRRLPYGANWLAWEDMTELREAIDERILFRYQTERESTAERLERAAARRFGARHALAVHNCTEGLRLALLATRPCVGDEVYIPSVTFVAVAGAVLSCGLIPVLVDVDERLALDPAALPPEADRLIVAHMEGFVSALPAGPQFVIEDAAQAMGGVHADGVAAGAAGTFGVFSFHHNKVLTSGEGGLVLCDDTQRFELMRRHHDHGSSRVHGEYPTWPDGAWFGENGVASEPIAAIQHQQLRHLDEILAGLERGHRVLADTLSERLHDLRIVPRASGDVPISLRLECGSPSERDRVVRALVDAGLPYWTLDRYFLPSHPVLRDRRSIYADGFPWSLARRPADDPNDFAATRERLARTVCLPVSPALDERAQLDEAERFALTLTGRARRRAPAARTPLLYVDDRPSTLTDALLARNDLQPILLRFGDVLDELPQTHLAATRRVPSFVVDPGRPLAAEAERLAGRIAQVGLGPIRRFCNPSEPRQHLAHALARKLGLPALSAEQVRWLREKPAMKRKLATLGLSVAAHAEVRTRADIAAFAGEHGWPVVVKPVDGYGCIDTYRLDAASELAALDLRPERRWMTEAFIADQEWECCALVFGGEVLDAWLSAFPAPPLAATDGAINANISLGGVPPWFPVDVQALVERIVTGMGLDHGYLHMELFVGADGRVTVSEVGLRLAGCEIPANHGLARGFNIFDALLDVHAGHRPDLRYARRRCVGDLLLPLAAGRVRSVTPLEELVALPGVIGGRLKVSAGETVRPRRTSFTSAGFVHVEGRSIAEVEERMHAVLAAFTVDVELATPELV